MSSTGAPNSRPDRLYVGETILCDYEPKTGQILKWSARRGLSKVRLDPNNIVVERDHRCLLRRQREGQKIADFMVGDYFQCKVHRFNLEGHVARPCDGALYVSTWYRTYSTAYQGRHITGRESNIYCIVLDGKVVFRPRVLGPVGKAAPETMGSIDETLRCII